MENYRIIDISMPMDAFYFPSNPKLDLEGPFNRVDGSNREYVYDFKLCSQSGTHVQGAHYYTEKGNKISDYKLERFEGYAYVMDCPKRGEDTTLEDFQKEIHDYDLKNKILILRTGHMDELIKDESFLDTRKRPGISLDAAKYLVEEKEVQMIAIDSVGVESRTTKNYEVNVYLCEHDMLILEGLVNLHDIKKDIVWLEAFPLKIEGVEGTPCRAIIKESI